LLHLLARMSYVSSYGSLVANEKISSVSGETLAPALIERVLLGLGLCQKPEITIEGLTRIYTAWCQSIPFDNVRKLIHVRSSAHGPLPGSTAQDFFEAWLKFGTGGTCWSGAGACYALLKSLGFSASRGVATMLVTPNVPPNQGTVLVSFGRERYLVDCSMLHGTPLELLTKGNTAIAHPAWGVRTSRRDGRVHIKWRPLHKTDGFECRLEHFGAEQQEFETLYDITRGWSPFNYELSARINRGDEVVGAGFGNAVRLCADGSVLSKRMDRAVRDQLLIEEIGIAEELVAQLPEDVKTPPPPWARTAEEAKALQRVS
jgi:arylamine N-acetyltransferase